MKEMVKTIKEITLKAPDAITVVVLAPAVPCLKKWDNVQNKFVSCSPEEATHQYVLCVKDADCDPKIVKLKLTNKAMKKVGSVRFGDNKIITCTPKKWLCEGEDRRYIEWSCANETYGNTIDPIDIEGMLGFVKKYSEEESAAEFFEKISKLL